MINPKHQRKVILALALIISVVLYLAGVYSGLYANKIIEQRTEQNIQKLKQETQEDLAQLETYISSLENNLNDMQLEQLFIQSLSQSEQCTFLQISLTGLVEQLDFYWDQLPFRLEEYEKNNPLTDEYLLLKEQYADLSIRIWLMAKTQQEQCNANIVHGLYFYSATCDSCIEQGEQLDVLNSVVRNAGSEMVLFPIDIASDDAIIQNLRMFYNITSPPALIINGQLFEGRLFSAEELNPLS